MGTGKTASSQMSSDETDRQVVADKWFMKVMVMQGTGWCKEQ